MNNKIEKLISEFKNPSLDYNPVVMWFWTGDIDEKGITFQLEKFKEQNIVQFFIHPCGGMTIQYLSDRFMELIQHAVKEAKRLGMKYWIYDECDWPSGMAGGLLKEMDRSNDQYELCCEPMEVGYHGHRGYHNQRGTFISAQRFIEKDGRYFVTDITDLCEVISENGCFNIQYRHQSVTPEKILVFYTKQSDRVIYSGLSRLETKGLRGYVNVLRESTIQKFIEMTHERYKKYIGEEFGKTVMGVFTDEPTTHYRFELNVAGPWDEEMEELFEKAYGYSIRPYLYALFYAPRTPEEVKARDDYKQLIGRRYLNAFIKPCAKWCKENNLIFTGHYGGEEHISAYLAQGDMQEALTYMDIPGMDTIHSRYKIDDYNFNIAGKLVSSAAKYIGADRILSETYTNSGWSFRFPQMKRIANRVLVTGANMIQFMGAPYTMRGNHKTLPGYIGVPNNYMRPVYRHYHAFNKYVAGVQYLSAQTKPDSDTLVFAPIRQITQNCNLLPRREIVSYDRTQRIYEDTVNSLLYEGIGFDIFSENFVDNVTVKDGYVEAFGYRYDNVIFPDMHYVNNATAELIKKLKANSVKMIFAHAIPSQVSETAKAVDFEFEGKPVCGYENEVLADGNTYLVNPVVWTENRADYRKFLKNVSGKVALNIESDGVVYIAPRSNDYCKVYLICNDDNKLVKTTFDAVPGMRIFDTYSYDELCYTAKDGRVTVALEPYEMIAVICGDEAAEGCTCTGCCGAAVAEEIALSDKMGFAPEGGNILPLKYEMFDKERQEWRKGSHVALPANVRLTINEQYQLRSEVVFDYVPEKVYLNAELYGVSDILINGKPVEPVVNTNRWSECDSICDITEYIKAGVNTFEYTATTDPTLNWVMPPYFFLTGDFAVSADDKVIAPVHEIDLACGWEKQGFRYFSGTACYTTKANIAADFTKAEVAVECTDSVEVWVNGEKAGIVLWAPNKVDVTSLLKKGENDIEIRVTSTLSNMLDIAIDTGLKAAKITLYK
ncbi:MAG: hypothetical protein IJC94_05020 [Oscillospiraceae bacterium]|nr:hypothetical protein [Oscillospiraceae bacterium]